MSAHECVYQDAVLFWKAEALLCALGKGTPIDRMVIAAVVPIPIPRDVALARMEEAKAALITAGIGGRTG